VDISDTSSLHFVDPLEREGLDKKDLVGNSPACFSVFLLVSGDRAAFYEDTGRKCLLENSVAAIAGGHYSIRFLPTDPSSPWLDKERPFSWLYGDYCIWRKGGIVCRMV
jgi:hypothetical protein